MTTGPAHWELLLRSRALDNQLFVAGVSVARDEDASYVAWGHSTVVDPWGRILVQAGEKEDIVYADVGEWGTISEHVMAVTPDASTRLLSKVNWIHSSLLLFIV